LIGLFELPEDESVPPDEHFIEIDDTPGISQTGYTLNRKYTSFSFL
jgi:exportin-2 (importin alpha re-exporter)